MLFNSEITVVFITYFFLYQITPEYCSGFSFCSEPVDNDSNHTEEANLITKTDMKTGENLAVDYQKIFNKTIAFFKTATDTDL